MAISVNCPTDYIASISVNLTSPAGYALVSAVKDLCQGNPGIGGYPKVRYKIPITLALDHIYQVHNAMSDILAKWGDMFVSIHNVRSVRVHWPLTQWHTIGDTTVMI